MVELLKFSEFEKLPVVADYLLNNTYLELIIPLKIGERKFFKPIEIEMYLYSDDHLDEYVHQHPRQLSHSKWYFHRGNENSYKNGTYKGLDLTFGKSDGEEKVYGGCLFRTIVDISSGKVIEGPSNTVTRLMMEYGSDSIKEFAEECEKRDVFSNNVLKLVKRKKSEGCTIYTSRRVGLSDKYPLYRELQLRYISEPRLIKKNRGDIREGMKMMGVDPKDIYGR